MMRRTWDPTFLAVLLATAMLVGTVLATGGIAPGEWRGRLEASGERLRLELRPAIGPGSFRWSFTIDPGKIAGFDAASFERDGAPLELRFAREAGTFLLTGEGGRRPRGPLRFEPGPEFVERWRALGFEPPTEMDLMRLAVDDVSIDDAVAVHGLGYRSVGASDLLRMSAHGISIEWLTEIQALGERPDLDDVVRLHAHGVSAEEAQALGRLGLRIATNDILRLHDHGIRPEYVGDMIEAGVDGDKVDDVVRLHARGISPDYVAGLRASGMRDVPLEDVLRLHDHGVAADYVRGMVDSGFDDLAAGEIVRLQAHGVPVDYAQVVVASTGRRDVGSAILLHDHGVGADWIREMAEAGYGTLAPSDMTRLHAHGISLELVRALARTDGPNPSVDELLRAR